MTAQVISSRDNKFIKKCIKLQTKARERKESRLFCIEGVRLCLDACLSGIRFKELAVSDSAMEKYSDSIKTLEENTEKLYYLSDSLFKYISDTQSPQGVMAIAEIPDNSLDVKNSGKYIALENLQDPSNLGAISRSAEAFGISGIILTESGCDPYSPKALRASMGALFRIPIIITENIISYAKENSLKTYACVVKGNAREINSVSFEGGSVAIIGNEGNGLEEETINTSDERITIPMSGRAESLNAAVAASVVIWEMQR